MSTFPRHDLDLLYLYKKPENIRDFLKDNPHLQKYNVEKTHDVLIWALDHLFRARNNRDDYARSLEFFKELARVPWPRKSLKRLVDQSFDLGVFDHLAGFNIKNLDLNFRKKLLEKMAKDRSMEGINRLMLHLSATQQNVLLSSPTGSLPALQDIINLYKTPVSHFDEAFDVLTRKRWEGMKMLLRDMPEGSLSDLVDFCIKKERYDFLNSVFDDFPLDVQKNFISAVTPKHHHKNLLSQKSRLLLLDGLNQPASRQKTKTKL